MRSVNEHSTYRTLWVRSKKQRKSRINAENKIPNEIQSKKQQQLKSQWEKEKREEKNEWKDVDITIFDCFDLSVNG